ncbi:MAG: GAK system XXXCH domain-containing protein [Desulfovibrionales bacterium]
MDLNELTSSLGNQLETISQKSEQGETPDESTALEFHRNCMKLMSVAPDEWYEEAEDFAHLANQLCKAVKQNRTKEAVLLVDSLGDAYNYLSTCF